MFPVAADARFPPLRPAPPMGSVGIAWINAHGGAGKLRDCLRTVNILSRVATAEHHSQIERRADDVRLARRRISGASAQHVDDRLIVGREAHLQSGTGQSVAHNRKIRAGRKKASRKPRKIFFHPPIDNGPYMPYITHNRHGTPSLDVQSDKRSRGLAAENGTPHHSLALHGQLKQWRQCSAINGSNDGKCSTTWKQVAGCSGNPNGLVLSCGRFLLGLSLGFQPEPHGTRQR